MRDLFENLLYYKKIYPYKFWGVIICTAVICFICFLLLWLLYKQRTANQEALALNQSIQEASEENESIVIKQNINQAPSKDKTSSILTDQTQLCAFIIYFVDFVYIK